MIAVTPGLLTTTAQYVEGRPVREYLGVVSGEAVVALRRWQRGGALETTLQRARLHVLRQLACRADARGATVVLGIDIGYVPVGAGRLLVAATGTAARL